MTDEASRSISGSLVLWRQLKSASIVSTRSTRKGEALAWWSEEPAACDADAGVGCVPSSLVAGEWRLSAASGSSLTASTDGQRRSADGVATPPPLAAAAVAFHWPRLGLSAPVQCLSMCGFNRSISEKACVQKKNNNKQTKQTKSIF